MNTAEKIVSFGFKFLDCLNFDDVRLLKKYNLICPNNHKINIRLDNITTRADRHSLGCPACHEENITKKSLENAKMYLPEDYKIIGFYRKNVIRKEARSVRMYKIECDEGHLFEIESGHMKNVNCPKCSEKIYVGQERTRKIFKEIFKSEFTSVRPDWLKNPNTGKNLELDGYCPKLNLAFEFQGRQHFEVNTQYRDEFEKQRKRDEIKKEICKKFGVKLVEIKQPSSYNSKKFINDVTEQIKSQINKQDVQIFDINISDKKFNFIDLSYKKLMPNVKLFFDFCANEAPVKNYVCLTNEFSTYEDKITMCCPKGHNFETTPAEFKRNILGKKGRSIPCLKCYAKTNVVNTKIDLNYCEIEGAIYGLTLLTKEYKNVNEKMDWLRRDGSIVSLSFRQIQRNKTKVF